MIEPLLSPALETFAPRIRHGFFSRQGGVSTGIFAGLNCGFGSSDDVQAVTENRRRVAAALNANGDGVVTLYQVHGSTAERISVAPSRDALAKADAVITTTPGLAIGVLTADCGPVLLADATAGVVAAAHAGWRGATGGILESVIARMCEAGAQRERITAAVGPCISQPAYEVGPVFAKDVIAKDENAVRFLTIPPGGAKEHFDLPGYIVDRLRRVGLNHVDRIAPCTHENESLFFSYRRATQRQEPDYGRQISAIVVA